MNKVIVDTSIWSLALRRRARDLSPLQRALAFHLRDLIIEGNAVLLGAIRQEILTGITNTSIFERLAGHLRDFDDLAPDPEDYERAASFANQCVRGGVAQTATDMLLCAVAVGRDLPILTADRDFERYAKHLPIQLFL